MLIRAGLWETVVMKKKKPAKTKATKSPQKRVHREDFSQAAARIVREATK
jgi:hypothetical protein